MEFLHPEFLYLLVSPWFLYILAIPLTFANSNLQGQMWIFVIRVQAT